MSKTSLDHFLERENLAPRDFSGDVYFKPDYAALYGEAFEFSFREGGRVFHTLAVKTSVANTPFFDLQTPYGYGGFSTNSNDEGFLQRALNALKSKAIEQKIIAFFIRFHPFDENLNLYQKHLNFFKKERQIVIVPTARPLAHIRRDYNPRIKSYVRKARVELELDIVEQGQAWDELERFHALYTQTMRRTGAGEFYFFDRVYFERLLKLEQNLLLKASFKGEILAYASFFMGRNFAYYHLSANSHQKNANAALLDYFFELCHQRGIAFALLGGGVSDGDDLFYFKQRFSTLFGHFHIGGLVCDEEAYRALSQGFDNNFFLKYRHQNGGGGGRIRAFF
ncbi:hypothetical protein [Campylobacter sp.]|uniref:hypothetical protein n=1 Tax=Campylobacter sp. TaxID=205 RepID=UPI0026DB24ED|nr:hypothetical protein [Campylobacter sp.]MDO4674417.1 hypothetical protein [Campylobacter sp.]